MRDYRDDFYEQYAMAAGHAGPPDIAEYEAMARQFRGRWNHVLPADSGAPMLDLGCGAGQIVRCLRGMGYQDVEGIDRSASEIARAGWAGVEGVLHADATAYLANRHKEYEAVFALNFFEHLRKDEIVRLLHLVQNALHPGGRLFVVTPNALSPFGGATRYWDFSHEIAFTPASWRQLARITGFQDPVFEEYGPIPHSIAGVVRSAAWQVVRLALVGLSYIEVGGPRDPSWTFTADMKVILTKR